MLICDISVAHTLFNPAFVGQFIPWLKNIIWFSYVPAWTLIVYISTKEDILAPPMSISQRNSLL